MTTSLPAPATAPNRRGLVLFLAVAYLGMWAAMAPLLVDGFRRVDGRAESGVLEQVCIAVAMCAPALAALLVLRFVEPVGRVRDALALRWPTPLPHAVRACGVALGVPALLTVAALGLGHAAGVYPVGEVHLRGFGTWATGALLELVVSLPLFFGEELGWQGYLFPRLAQGGQRRRLVLAYLVTGTAFALWHVPTLLMGGQYPGRPWYVSVPAMLVSCTLALPLLTWLRLRSGSVLPAVLGHACVSTVSVSMVREFADRDATLDPLHMGLFGWPGWIVMGALVAWLALTGRLRISPTAGSAGRPGDVQTTALA